jgi:hypothetical protein
VCPDSGTIIWSTIVCVRLSSGAGVGRGEGDGGWYIASCFCPRWGAGAIPSHRRGNETPILGSTFILPVLCCDWSSYCVLIGGAATGL